MSQTTFLQALVASLQRAGRYNKNDMTPPAVVLWTDKERQWEPLLPQLRAQLPLLTFGAYAPAERRGPAYYLLCMIARALEDRLTTEAAPIIYFPGVSRQELRAVEASPKELKPLAELQYRGVFWTHKNARDWSIAAFLQAPDSLNISVASDDATRHALLRALSKLADEPLTRLQAEAPLRAPFLDALLNPDQERSILVWLDDAASFQASLSHAEWAAFCSGLKLKYGVDPVADGTLAAAQQLAKQNGAWQAIWRRYADAPQAFPNIAALLRAARPPQLTLFDLTEAFPQDNEQAEQQLRHQLNELRANYQGDARAQVHELEKQNAARRKWVWAKLDQAPLANALEHLERLAIESQRALGGSTVNEIAAQYAEWGWRVDAAALAALGAVEKHADAQAVQAAVNALYRPWLEHAAHHFQNAVAKQTYPFTSLAAPPHGTCILFSDALRYDVAIQLAAQLGARGFATDAQWRLAALPTITPTAKYAVSPIASLFTGSDMPKLEPALRGSNAPLNSASFRRALQENGYQILQGDELGEPTGRAWTEWGAIDRYGHEHPAQLARHIQNELKSIALRVEQLLSRGWKQTLLVTDHGWLLLAGGLPKIELPEHLTVLRKGRCARLADNALTDQMLVPWFWDANGRVAVAAGIGCYEAGKEYEHGGVSVQECVVPQLTISHSASAGTPNVQIESVKWRGLRCAVQLKDATTMMRVDLRTKAGDANSSLAAPRTPNAEGTASLLVEDEDVLASAAFVVVLSERGTILAQQHTTVGE